jgi:hypothetical protein
MDRKEMARILGEWMASSYTHFKESGRLPTGRNPLKSYIVEANVPEANEQRDGIKKFFANAEIAVPVEVLETDDTTLQVIRIGRKRVEFFLDTLDPRFWFLHTTSTADAADSAVRSLVQRTRLLDSTWLPTRHLETWAGELGVPRVLTAKFSVPTGLYREDLPEEEFLDESLFLRVGSTGDARERWRAYQGAAILAPSLALWSARIVRREPDRESLVVDDVTAVGKLTCRGNSFRVHQELLLGLKNRYAELIREWEQRFQLSWVREATAVRPTGSTAEVILPEPLPEHQLEELLESMFNCGEPYRLYGVPIRQGTLRYIVRGVDLHTGDRIDFEVYSDLLRIYLHPTTCANVIARLLTNLQHYHDARVELA